ncbi:MAG: hypothetical protein E4H10_14030 [Bacteroidia bacterium]|nr:MAG: hypothetical protein E4H10_14030 [Bacteroidia bacterium]
MKKILLIAGVTFGLFSQTLGQVYTNKVVGEKNIALADTLMSKPYPYSLPIWGAKATAKGYDLPYSAGVSLNYFWQQSDLLINELFVGFNDGPMYDLDEVIRFNNAVATASIITIRPDIWLLPFLNVYGIFSKAKTSTAIDAGLYLPDTSNVWNEVTSFSSTANFDATAMGFGITPTLGIGGGWMALDMNMTWSDISALNKPVFSFVFGPRFGKTFKFKNPQRNIAVWAGGFRVHLSAETNGSLLLSEVLPLDDAQAKVDEGMTNVADAVVQVDEWWTGLSTVEQKNPVNVARYETANRVLQKSGEILNTLAGALNDEESASVQYSLTKRPKDKWNFIVGAQFQINKHFMLRAEYGFLGSRQQFMTGLQYRFGL